MAVTHGDLSLRNNGEANTDRWPALFLAVLSVLCGVAGFFLCVLGEALHSEVTWMSMSVLNSKKFIRYCYYSRSGKTPVVLAAVASLLFSVAMMSARAYLLVAVAVASPSSPETHMGAGSSAGTVWSPSKKAALLCIPLWILFFIAEFFLVLAIYDEAGHLNDWTKLRLGCSEIDRSFAIAGFFGLLCNFLGVSFYIITLRYQRLFHDENMGPHRQSRGGAPPQEPQAMRAYQNWASSTSV